MPIPGFERATRDVERAAEATRSRSRRRTEPGELPEMGGETACGRCGVRLSEDDAYVTGAGPRCVACFRDEEVEQVDASPWSALAPTAAATLVFGMVALPLAQALREWGSMGPRPLGGVYGVVALTACVGLLLTVQWLRVARDGFAPSLYAEESPVPRIIRAGLATLLALWTLITTGGLVIFTLL